MVAVSLGWEASYDIDLPRSQVRLEKQWGVMSEEVVIRGLFLSRMTACITEAGHLEQRDMHSYWCIVYILSMHTCTLIAGAKLIAAKCIA
jgi:hypothetical protein